MTTQTTSSRNVLICTAEDLRGNQPEAYSAFMASISTSIGGLNPESTEGRVALRIACANGARYVQRLGGVTFRYAMWAAVDPRNGNVLILDTADDRGRWMMAGCRPWNGGNKL